MNKWIELLILAICVALLNILHEGAGYSFGIGYVFMRKNND